MNWLNTPLLFKTILDLGVLLITVLLMFTVGMELEGRNLREVAQRKWTVGMLLGGQMVLLPSLGIAVAHALELPPHLRAGILLVAACPDALYRRSRAGASDASEAQAAPNL